MSNNVSNNESPNLNTHEKINPAPASKDTSAKANTSSKFDSSDIEKNGFQVNSTDFQKPDATTENMINPNIQGETNQQALIVNSPNQASGLYNQPISPPLLSAVSIDWKMNLKKRSLIHHNRRYHKLVSALINLI